MSETPVTDFVGREIKVGDMVAYPVRKGSKMWLSKILVTHVFKKPPKLVGVRDNQRVELHKLSNVVRL